MKILRIIALLGVSAWLLITVIDSGSSVTAGEVLDIIGGSFLFYAFANEVFTKEESSRFNDVMKTLAFLLIIIGIILRGSIF